MHTIKEIITIAKVTEYLFLNRINEGNVFADGTDLEIPYKIYNIRKSLEWAYKTQSSPGTFDYTFDSTFGEFLKNDIINSLTHVANYLYALCLPFNKEAENIINRNFYNFIITENFYYILSENGLNLITETT